jgi:hypothetical protein
MRTPNLLLKLAVTVCVVVAGLLLAGCKTTEPASEIPWSVPQDWESSPMMPGMNGGR